MVLRSFKLDMVCETDCRSDYMVTDPTLKQKPLLNEQHSIASSLSTCATTSTLES